MRRSHCKALPPDKQSATQRLSVGRSPDTLAAHRFELVFRGVERWAGQTRRVVPPRAPTAPDRGRCVAVSSFHTASYAHPIAASDGRIARKLLPFGCLLWHGKRAAEHRAETARRVTRLDLARRKNQCAAARVSRAAIAPIDAVRRGLQKPLRDDRGPARRRTTCPRGDPPGGNTGRAILCVAVAGKIFSARENFSSKTASDALGDTDFVPARRVSRRRKRSPMDRLSAPDGSAVRLSK